MPSYEYKIDEKSRAGSRFITSVNDELRRALVAEKSERKLTQQAIADILGVNRSVVNRRCMGLENMTARSIGEMFWAIGWEPYFEARKIEQNYGNYKSIEVAGDGPSTSASEGLDRVRVRIEPNLQKDTEHACS